MKTIFDINDSATHKVVGTITIEGNFGELAFRVHYYRLLEFYKIQSTKTDDEIHNSLKRSVTISMYPDTSGDYVCDGKNDDVEFKAALEYLQAIHDSDQKEAS